MAPTAMDPKDLKVILNPARRRALAALIETIISHMRDRIEQSFHFSPTEQNAPLFVGNDSPRDPGSPSSFPDPEVAERQRRSEAKLTRSYSSPKLQSLKRDALQYFDKWAAEVKTQLRKAFEGPEDPRADQRRREWQASQNPPPPPYTASASTSSLPPLDVQIAALQSLYTPIPTRLTTIPYQERIFIISATVLFLLSLGHYSAHSRILLLHLTSSLSLPLSVLVSEETAISITLLHASKTLSADPHIQERQAANASSRRWKVGLAAVAGAAVIGITGGLAAPVVAGAIGGIMGGVGLGGVASFLGIFAMNGALVGSLFGAFGGKMTGEMVDQYAKEVSDFKFVPLSEEWGPDFSRSEAEELEARRLRVTIGINGWLNEKDDVVKPWRVLSGDDSEVFALRYELDALLDLGISLKNMVSSYAWSYVKLEILKRTVLATLWAALWPLALLKMAASIDNPFAVAKHRSEKAGEVLADALIHRAQGERPVTLIGYSLGARVIYSCLRSLAERRAFGLVESVVFIGAPVPSDTVNWTVLGSVVSGRVVNVFSENDYILAFLYRATSVQMGVAGLQSVGAGEVDNLDLSKEVSGHLRYPELVGKILKKVGFEGVKVEDSTIVGDEGEISLVDVERGEKKSGDLIDFDEPSQPSGSGSGSGQARGDSAMDDLMWGISGLDMNASSSSSAPPRYRAELEGHIPTSIRRKDVAEPVPPLMPPRRKTEPPPRNDDPFASLRRKDVAPQTKDPLGASTPQDLSVDSLILGLDNMEIHPPSKSLSSLSKKDQKTIYSPPASSVHRENDGYSSDEGGIQMVDNDSDSGGELQMVESVPIPDDEEVDEGTKWARFEEPKSLGGFPKDIGSGVGSGSGGGNRIGSGNGSGSGNQGQPRKNLSAKDMGLY